MNIGPKEVNTGATYRGNCNHIQIWRTEESKRCLSFGCATGEAFALLVFALTEMHLQGFYLLNTNAFLSDYTKAFEGSFEVQLPQLFANFQEQGYEPMFYLVDWFSTMFLRVGGFDLALLVMDLFYAGVDEVLFRVALAILRWPTPLVARLRATQTLATTLASNLEAELRFVRPARLMRRPSST